MKTLTLAIAVALVWQLIPICAQAATGAVYNGTGYRMSVTVRRKSGAPQMYDLHFHGRRDLPPDTIDVAAYISLQDRSLCQATTRANGSENLTFKFERQGNRNRCWFDKH